jgi:hypothetical protein
MWNRLYVLPLTTGTRLGEEYKATDTGLKRTVAIKVLAASFRAARSARHLQPESSSHLHALRHRPAGRHAKDRPVTVLLNWRLTAGESPRETTRSFKTR